MSGGSLAYLYGRDTAEEIMGYVYGENLQKIPELLAAYPNATSLIKEVERYIIRRRLLKAQIETAHEVFRDLFHAIEWEQSGDSGTDRVQREIDSMLKEQTL